MRRIRGFWIICVCSLFCIPSWGTLQQSQKINPLNSKTVDSSNVDHCPTSPSIGPSDLSNVENLASETILIRQWACMADKNKVKDVHKVIPEFDDSVLMKMKTIEMFKLLVNFYVFHEEIQEVNHWISPAIQVGFQHDVFKEDVPMLAWLILTELLARKTGNSQPSMPINNWNGLQIGKLIAASLLVALKAEEDIPYNNKSFSRLFNLSIEALNESEIDFLYESDFCLPLLDPRNDEGYQISHFKSSLINNVFNLNRS